MIVLHRNKDGTMGFQDSQGTQQEGFPVYVHGKNFLITPAIKAHVEENLRHLKKLHASVLYVDVTLELFAKEHVCLIVLHTDRMNIQAKASSTDLYLAITLAEKKVVGQFGRWKSRLQDYHKKSLSAAELELLHLHPLESLEGEVLNGQDNTGSWQPGQVVSREKFSMKTLTIEEAVMQMDLSENSFLVFKDEVDQRIKIIYPRSLGQYSLITIQ